MDIELIPLKTEHLEIVRTWRNAKDVAQYMYTEDYISKQDQIRWFDRISVSKTHKYWIIYYNKIHVGVVYLYDIDARNKRAFWGFYLGDASIRGAGIGGKVEYHILSYVFDTLNLHKLCCEVLGSNEAVINMHKKFGFVEEGFFREHICKNDQFYDVYRLGILADDWKKLKESLKRRVYRERS